MAVYLGNKKIAGITDTSDKVDKAQGIDNAGKALIVGADGLVTVGQAGAPIDDTTPSATTLYSSQKVESMVGTGIITQSILFDDYLAAYQAGTLQDNVWYLVY